MSLDAVVLLRIADWDPPDELDARVLDDGTVLLYLEHPFDADSDALAEALAESVGAPLLQHDDARGMLVFPDAAEPDDADGYDAVVTAVEGHGFWLAPVHGADAAQVIHQGVQAVLDDALSAMGLGGVDDLAKLLSESDPAALAEARERAQRVFQGAMLTDAQKAAVPVEPPTWQTVTVPTPNARK